jgi:hypothetical protein
MCNIEHTQPSHPVIISVGEIREAHKDLARLCRSTDSSIQSAPADRGSFGRIGNVKL